MGVQSARMSGLPRQPARCKALLVAAVSGLVLFTCYLQSGYSSNAVTLQTMQSLQKLTSRTLHIRTGSFKCTDRSSPQVQYAYVFYVAQDIYHCAALINVHQLQQLGKRPNIDTVVLVPSTYRIPEAAKQQAQQLNVVYMQLPALPLGKVTGAAADLADHYKDTMMKFYVFSLTQYKRVLFLDADQLVMQNMDSLFKSAPAADLLAPRAYWLSPGRFPAGYSSEGWHPHQGPEVGPQQKFGSYFMLIQPSCRLWHRLYDKYYPKGQASYSGLGYDMDILNVEFKDEIVLLPGSMVVLTNDYVTPEDRRPQQVRHISREAWWKGAYAVHFSEPSKVWVLNATQLQNEHPDVQPQLHDLWMKWWSLKDDVCTGFYSR